MQKSFKKESLQAKSTFHSSLKWEKLRANDTKYISEGCSITWEISVGKGLQLGLPPIGTHKSRKGRPSAKVVYPG